MNQKHRTPGASRLIPRALFTRLAPIFGGMNEEANSAVRYIGNRRHYDRLRTLQPGRWFDGNVEGRGRGG